MKRKASIPAFIYKALKKGDHKTLLKCKYNIKYTPSKKLARVIVKYITKDLPRLNGEKLCQTIRLRFHELPLDIKIDASFGNFDSHPKVLWYMLHSADKYVHRELLRYFEKKHYTSYEWTKQPNTICIHTYN